MGQYRTPLVIWWICDVHKCYIFAQVVHFRLTTRWNRKRVPSVGCTHALGSDRGIPELGCSGWAWARNSNNQDVWASGHALRITRPKPSISPSPVATLFTLFLYTHEWQVSTSVMHEQTCLPTVEWHDVTKCEFRMTVNVINSMYFRRNGPDAF